jgi:hypothetical protein
MVRSLFFLIILVFFFGCVSTQTTTPRVCFGERCVLVEIADSPDERSRGLMDRDVLPGNNGMIFVFDEESVHGFWMKNTRIPLDAIWINSLGEVVDIITMFPCEKDPCPVYTPAGNANYVVEINAGLAKTWNIRRGDAVQLVGV